MTARSLVLVVAAFTLVGSAAACDDGSAGVRGPEASSVRELADNLMGAGVACEELVRDDTAEREASGVVDSGECVIESTNVGLSIFEDAEQLELLYGRRGRSLACDFAKPAGVEVLPGVVGPIWTIAVESTPETGEDAERLARRIAEAMGASVRIVRCDTQETSLQSKDAGNSPSA